MPLSCVIQPGMTQMKAITNIQKDERIAARTATARRYARKMFMCLIILCLVAIWQDKRLAPPLHNGMQVVSGIAMEYIENSETLSEVLAAAQKSYAELGTDG